LHGYTGDGVITAADLTLNNLLTTFQVSAAGSVVIPIDTSFIPDLLIANEIFAGFALRNVTDPSGVFTFYTVDSGFEQFNPILTLELDGPGRARAWLDGAAGDGAGRLRKPGLAPLSALSAQPRTARMRLRFSVVPLSTSGRIARMSSSRRSAAMQSSPIRVPCDRVDTSPAKPRFPFAPLP
jgi:hypothetical protein